MDDDIEEVVDWRWSKLDPTFFGLHASVLLIIPVFLISMWTFGATQHWKMLMSMIFLCCCYVAFLIYIARLAFTPIEYVKYCFYRYVVHGEWSVRQW